MRLLVLGGTGFLGYHVVAAALHQNHEVSVFTRGGEAPAPEVEVLHGDRYGDLSALDGREWDAVLDTFSDPDPVAETARRFSGSAGAYGFISGITNYHPEGPQVVDEDSPLRVSGEARPGDPLQETGLAKLGCESAALDNFSGRTLIARPGIMVGPRDPTDRFSWWPARLYRALVNGDEEILAPGDPDRHVQFTDARDLAAWIVSELNKLSKLQGPASDKPAPGDAQSGIYNTVGPGRRETLSSVLDACHQAARELAESSETTSALRFTWASEEFLENHLSETPEEQRPLWFPEPQIPFREVDSSRALGEGLSFRPTLDTARDTLHWLGSRASSPSDELAAGLSPDFEQNLLRLWKEHRP